MLCVGIAAICNAVMDVTQFHFEKSIFSSLNPKWWNGSISWKNKYIDGEWKNGRVKWLWGIINKPVQLTDAFHFFKMLMVIFMCLGVIIPHPPMVIENSILSFLIVLLMFGGIWIMFFNIFYKFLKKY